MNIFHKVSHALCIYSLLRIDNKIVKHKMVNISWAGALGVCGWIRDIRDNSADFVLAALVSSRGQPANYSTASSSLWKTFAWRWYNNTETRSEFLSRKLVTKHVSVYNWTYSNSVSWTPMQHTHFSSICFNFSVYNWS
jgi:hypothetical protein